MPFGANINLHQLQLFQSPLRIGTRAKKVVDKGISFWAAELNAKLANETSQREII